MVSILFIFGSSGPQSPILKDPISESVATPTTPPAVETGLQFIENLGQYGVGAGRYYIQLAESCVVFGESWVSFNIRISEDSSSGVLVKMTFESSNRTSPVGINETGSLNHFFLGNDSSKWVINARSFREVWYPQLWNGIDLQYVIDGRNIKYNFFVERGGNPTDIRMRYEGIEGLEIDSGTGDLIIETTEANIADHRPISYQDTDEGKIEIDTSFSLASPDTIRFQTTGYDPEYPLLIDPTMEFCTLVGGISRDHGTKVSLDKDGFIYCTGYTRGSGFPVTPGVYSTVSGDFNAILFKVSNNGSKANIYLCGETQSPEFPTTNGSLSSRLQGIQDGFLLVLDSNGTTLKYSSYIGGEGREYANDIDIINGKELFLVGRTNSFMFPVSEGAYDTHFDATDQRYDYDGYVMKIDLPKISVNYSTYLGGWESDWCYAVCVNEDGNAIATGHTESGSFPTTTGAFDRTHNGRYDAFISVLSQDGSALLYSTYIGGGSDDFSWDVCTDNKGSIFITGATSSRDFPVSDSSFDNEHNGGEDGFVVKIDDTCSKISFATFIGGPEMDRSTSLCINEEGFVYITGRTRNDNFPITKDAWQDTSKGGEDAFLTRFFPSGSDIDYSTYFGGQDGAMAYDITYGPNRSVYITGVGSHEVYTGDAPKYIVGSTHISSAFLVKYSIEELQNLTISIDPGPKLYAEYQVYDLIVDANPSHIGAIPDSIRVGLDPMGANVWFEWRNVESENPFKEIVDIDGCTRFLSDSRNVQLDEMNATVFLNFRFVPNWTWPHEDMCDVAIEISRPEPYDNVAYWVKDAFSVENDLGLFGAIALSGEWQGDIPEDGWTRVGENVTISGPMVIYEGTTDKYPPDGVCKVVLHDNDGDEREQVHVRDRPVSMSYQMDWITDFNETLTLQLEDLPDSSICINNLTFGIQVDGEEPTFENPVPGPDDWHSSHRVLTSITVNDTQTSGVDAMSLQYSYSTDEGDTFTQWSRVGLSTTTSGPTTDGLVSLDLTDGDGNYIRWRAKDLVGNGYAISQLFRIMVDTKNVTFTNPFPSGWQISTNLPCGVTIRDVEGSGISVVSIQFRVSFHNLSSYSDWVDWDNTGMQDSMEVITETTIEFVESPFNYIQWRAKDIAGNGFTRSPSYLVPVDSTPLVFLDFFPHEDDIQNTSDVQCWVTAWDGENGSGVDLSSIEMRVDAGNGSYSPWSNVGMEGGDFQSRFSVWITSSDGENLIQFRGLDRAGNGPWESMEFSFLADTTGPDFLIIEPLSENKQASDKVEVKVRIEDSLSGVDDGRIAYRFCQNGGDLPDSWAILEAIQDGDEWVGTVLLDLTEGNSNLIQFTAFDNVGNAGTSEIWSIWVNSIPHAVITGGKIQDDDNIIRLSAEESYDPDGDVLSFAWYIDDNIERLGADEIFIIDSYDLPPSNYSIVLVVWDDIQAESRDRYQFTVEPEQPPRIREGGFPFLYVLLLLFTLILVTMYVMKIRIKRDIEK